MLRKHAGLLGVFFFVTDALLMAGCFLAAFHLKRRWVLADPELDLRAHLNLLAVEGPLIMAILLVNGQYASRCILSGLGAQVRRVARGVLIAFAAFMVVSVYVKMFDYSRMVFSLFFVSLGLGLCLSRVLVAACRPILQRNSQWVRRVLVVGSGDSPELKAVLGRLMSSPYCRFEVVPLDCCGPGQVPPAEILGQIEQGKVDSVLVDLPCTEIGKVSALIERAECEGVPVYLTQRILPASMFNLAWEPVGGLPLIALRPLDISLAGRVVKRSMDVVLSLLALVGLSPALLGIALAVKLTSRGPVLYRQRRVGLDGREFTILKFRSMPVDAEAGTGPIWAKEEDPRCTPLGAFLRRAFLDELPQFWNVLRGDMSLVGPRPERPEFVSQFKSEIERYAHKHWVRPGVTGWAQINGWRGDTDLAERIRHDLWYIEHWSVWLDVKICCLTAVRVLTRTW